MNEPRVCVYGSEREKEKEASVLPGKAAGARPSLGTATGSFVLVLAPLISSQDRFDQPSVCLPLSSN